MARWRYLFYRSFVTGFFPYAVKDQAKSAWAEKVSRQMNPERVMKIHAPVPYIPIQHPQPHDCGHGHPLNAVLI